MALFLFSPGFWSRWLRLTQVIVTALFWVMVRSVAWSVAGLFLASLAAGLAMLPAILWPAAFQRFMPWYLNQVPLWIAATGMFGGGVLGFVHTVRLILGEVRRALFFAEIKEIADQIVEEGTQPSSTHVYSATSPSRQPAGRILSTETGLSEPEP